MQQSWVRLEQLWPKPDKHRDKHTDTTDSNAPPRRAQETVKFEEGLKQTVDWFTVHGSSFWASSDLDSVLVAHPVPMLAIEPPLVVDATTKAV